MISSHLNVTLLFLSHGDILQYTPFLMSEQNGSLQLFHKLLLKVLPVTTFYVRNSRVILLILCLYVVHIGAFAVM